MDRIVQVLLILRAEIAREQHARAGRKAGEEADEQLGDIGACRHRRKRGRADRLPDDDGLYAVIEVLEDLADEDRQREEEKLDCDVALCQVL